MSIEELREVSGSLTAILNQKLQDGKLKQKKKRLSFGLSQICKRFLPHSCYQHLRPLGRRIMLEMS